MIDKRHFDTAILEKTYLLLWRGRTNYGWIEVSSWGINFNAQNKLNHMTI